MTAAPLTDAVLPTGRPATAPPERRGIARDGVKLLVASRRGIRHDTFRHLTDHLAPGDVVVVNTSATRAAAVDARWRGRPVVLHLSGGLEDGEWAVEIRRTDGMGPVREALPGEVLHLAGGGHLVLRSPFRGSRLWRAELRTSGEPAARPVTYGYADTPWPLSDYQTIFARPDDPTGASAEMPSAARPFSLELVTELVKREVLLTSVSLHAGVSSLERHEPPPPERFRVPAGTADAVNAAHRRGGRVVAVGTTVTRALESAAEPDGEVSARGGWTDLILTKNRPARVVTGLVTGWHPPDASHIHLLEAVAGPALLTTAYQAAVDNDYLWHEFGDSCLLLP